MDISSITAKEIEDTHARINKYTVKTPFIFSAADLSRLGINVRSLGLKLELFQKTGTFKARGVINTLLETPKERNYHGKRWKSWRGSRMGSQTV
jgi:threonine dehydratase